MPRKSIGEKPRPTPNARPAIAPRALLAHGSSERANQPIIVAARGAGMTPSPN
jgi:hypothetical protein